MILSELFHEKFYLYGQYVIYLFDAWMNGITTGIKKDNIEVVIYEGLPLLT